MNYEIGSGKWEPRTFRRSDVALLHEAKVGDLVEGLGMISSHAECQFVHRAAEWLKPDPLRELEHRMARVGLQYLAGREAIRAHIDAQALTTATTASEGCVRLSDESDQLIRDWYELLVEYRAAAKKESKP